MKHPPFEFEYSKITPYIYLGTNLCCIEHFKKSLLSKGIHADINLELENLDQPIGVDYYLWLPTKDHTAPSLKKLQVGVAFIKELVRRKIKCYVHCKRGHGRSPTLVATYLISEGKSVEEAIGYVKKKRPSIHPNKHHLKALRGFAQTIKKDS